MTVSSYVVSFRTKLVRRPVFHPVSMTMVTVETRRRVSCPRLIREVLSSALVAMVCGLYYPVDMRGVVCSNVHHTHTHSHTHTHTHTRTHTHTHTHTELPTDCPAGLIIDQCGAYCQETCDDVLSGELKACILICGPPACVCPQGLVRYRDRCVDPRECYSLDICKL